MIRIYRDGNYLLTLTTNSNGRYHLELDADVNENFRSGTYTADEIVPDGFRQTTADPSVTVTPSPATTREVLGGSLAQLDPQVHAAMWPELQQ